jgi:hypothetical protein
MPLEARPLFRPDTLRPHLTGFALPATVEPLRPKLKGWADLIELTRAVQHTLPNRTGRSPPIPSQSMTSDSPSGPVISVGR